jgi:hypothetical protein
VPLRVFEKLGLLLATPFAILTVATRTTSSRRSAIAGIQQPRPSASI